jgi:translation initiation factor IF-2
MMDVPITKVIGTCMSLGIMVTMNQRLDAETLTIVADEFGYEVEFITVDIEEAKLLKIEEDLVSEPLLL